MKVQKRISAAVLAIVLTLSVTACGSSPASSGASSSSAPASSAAAEKTTVRVGMLKGPTGLGMLKLQADAKAKPDASLQYTFTVDTSPTAAAAKLTSGTVDIASLPTNMAATLYHKTSGKVKLLAVNTLGMMSVVTNGVTVSSVQDLKGKTVYISGKGAVPEYAFRYILKQNGLQPDKDVKLVFAAEHAEVLAKMISGQAKIAVLPEPFVTQLCMKQQTAKVALNLTKEWDSAAKGGSVLTMGCLAVNSAFVQQHPQALQRFLQAYQASTEYANQHPEEVGSFAQSALGIPAKVAVKAIPNCSITYLDGAQMKQKVQPFFQVLYQENPKSVGGALPDDGFYYQK